MRDLDVPDLQLVQQQADPVQEEHREGPRGGQHVRREGRTGRRRQPWRIPRSEYFLCQIFICIQKV